MKYFILFSLLGSLLLSCSEAKSEEVKETPAHSSVSEALKAKHVEGFVLKPTELKIPVNTVGNVKAIRKGKITSQVSGIFHFEYIFQGKSFKKGDVIGRITDIDFDNTYRQTYASFEKAYIKFLEDDIEDTYRDKQPLKLLVLIDNAKNRSLIGRARNTGLYEELLKVKAIEKERTLRLIKANRNLVITQINVENGQSVSKGTALFDYVDNDDKVVEVSLFEKEAAYLSIGEEARVKRHAIPSETFYSGHVIGVAKQISQDRFRTVTIQLDDAPSLVDGEQVDVIIDISTKRTGLQIPNKAVVYRDQRPVVFTEKDGLALWNYVTLGERFGNSIEIVGGVSEGDHIITKGHFTLAHQANVSFKTAKQ